MIDDLLRLRGNGFLAEQPAACSRMLTRCAENGVVADRHRGHRPYPAPVSRNKAHPRRTTLRGGIVGNIDTAEHNATGFNGPQIKQRVSQFRLAVAVYAGDTENFA